MHVVGVARRNAEPGRLQPGAHARDRAVVIGALHVDRRRESALPLRDMVRDVGDEIRVPAVRLPHHAVLVVAVVGGLQPQRAVLLVGLARRDEPRDRGVDPAVGVERSLQIVVVELHAERLQVPILLAAQLGDREMADRLDVAEVVADLVEIALRQLADVFAAVALLGKRAVLAEQLLRAGAHRYREILDLLAGVVVVELARDLRSLPLEQPRERVAKRGLASVPDMQRAGRIGRDELDHHALAAPRFAAPVAVGCGENARHHRLARRRRHEDVDEAGARDVDLRHPFGTGQRGDELRGELARIALQRLGVL